MCMRNHVNRSINDKLVGEDAFASVRYCRKAGRTRGKSLVVTDSHVQEIATTYSYLNVNCKCNSTERTHA